MPLPGPLRAAVGLVASAADEARRLPDRAIELPMLAVSSALQASLRLQQRYARYTARGDDVLNRRPPTAHPPPWATFDDPVDPPRAPSFATDAPVAERAGPLAAHVVQEILGRADTSPDGDAPTAATTSPKAAGEPSEKRPGTKSAGKPAKAGAKKDGPKKDGPKNGGPKKAAAKKDGPKKSAKKATTKSAAKEGAAKNGGAKKATTQRAGAAGAAASSGTASTTGPGTAGSRNAGSTDAGSTDAGSSTGKTISKPRHIAPSAFDDVEDAVVSDTGVSDPAVELAETIEATTDATTTGGANAKAGGTADATESPANPGPAG